MSQRPNKFASVISAAREAREPAPEVPPSPAAPPQPPAPEPAAPPPPTLPTRARPATGKRSNPDFEQVTAYVRRETNRAIRLALVQDPARRDFSDLVEELLQAWLRDQPQP